MTRKYSRRLFNRASAFGAFYGVGKQIREGKKGVGRWRSGKVFQEAVLKAPRLPHVASFYWKGFRSGSRIAYSD